MSDQQLLAAYRRADVAITLTRVSGADHGFTNVDREGLLQASAEFLARHLHAGCGHRRGGAAS